MVQLLWCQAHTGLHAELHAELPFLSSESYLIWGTEAGLLLFARGGWECSGGGEIRLRLPVDSPSSLVLFGGGTWPWPCTHLQHSWAGLSSGSAEWWMDGWTDGQAAGHLSDPVAGQGPTHCQGWYRQCFHVFLPWQRISGHMVKGPHLHGSNHPTIKQFS